MLPGLDEIINESNESIPEEINIPFENQIENNSYFLNDDISPRQIYFNDHTFNKFSTPAFSNNTLDNIIEKCESDEVSEGNYPFLKKSIELEENAESKINIFQTKKYKIRGRIKTNNTNRKNHGKTADDNVLTKIQDHFFKFLIDVSNNIIEPYFQAKKNNECFKQINYDIKRNITSDHISRLKTCSIKDILQMKISPKYKKYGEDYNKELCDTIYEEAKNDKNLSWIKNFFDMNYLKVFQEYYSIDKNRNYFVISDNLSDKEINISENTKPFYNLLEKNTEIQERLETISKRHFIGVKKPRKKKFLISKKKN
jgi:hypothetical protein